MRTYKINRKFGRKLKKVRKDKELSQEQLAEMLKMSRNHFGRLEAGSVNVTLVQVERIARVLKVKPSEILPF